MNAPAIYWDRGRDNYGRTVYYAVADGQTLGAVVRLPKTAHRLGKFLANDWRLADRDAAVTYHQTIAAAKAAIAG